MPDTEREELDREMPRFQTAIPAWCFVFFGFAIAGSLGAPFALGASSDLPDPALGVMAALGSCVGAFLVHYGLRPYACRMQRRRRAARGLAPWCVDHPWNPQGWRERPVRQVVGAALLIAVPAMLLLPFNLHALQGLPEAWLVLAILDLAALALAAWAAYMIARALKYGSSRISYARFPFFLGETLSVQLEAPRLAAASRPLTVTLRYIEEVRELVQMGSKRSWKVVQYELYSDSRQVRGTAFEGGTALEISFPLPKGDLSTRIASDPPRYWELEVESEARGIDYVASFLVPVYARP